MVITMMGIIADPADDLLVREFFELFKTPWEHYRSDREYEVVICVGDLTLERIPARLFVLFAAQMTSFDDERQIKVRSTPGGLTCSYPGARLPLSGRSVTFSHPETSLMLDEASSESVAYFERRGEQVCVRVGYDLLREVHTLLTEGQPSSESSTATLDIHIAILRDIVVGSGIPLVEIPPAPDRYPFMVCLTHDVDHASIRRHRLDHTMFGFLYIERLLVH